MFHELRYLGYLVVLSIAGAVLITSFEKLMAADQPAIVDAATEAAYYKAAYLYQKAVQGQCSTLLSVMNQALSQQSQRELQAMQQAQQALARQCADKGGELAGDDQPVCKPKPPETKGAKK